MSRPASTRPARDVLTGAPGRPMSVHEAVEARIMGDPVLQEALARGIVNARALSRWLIKTGTVEASEDTVMRAVRERFGGTGAVPFAAARAVHRASHLNRRSHMCMIHMRNNAAAQRLLPGLLAGMDPLREEVLRVIISGDGIQLFMDERNLDRTRAALGDADVLSVRCDLAELSVLRSISDAVPGVLAVEAMRLALQGINLVGIVTGVHHDIFFVDDSEAFEAYRLLYGLSRGL